MEADKSKLSPLYPSENEAFWKRHVEALKKSGLSRKDYSRQHNINYDRFGYWLPKLSHTPSSSLVSVQLKTQPPTVPTQIPTLCTLTLGLGRELKIYDVQALSLILEKLG